MATFVLCVNLDNAAFADDPAAELSRILSDAARKTAGIHHELLSTDDATGVLFHLRDINGNTVGGGAHLPTDPLDWLFSTNNKT